jgi:hypothetical protein
LNAQSRFGSDFSKTAHAIQKDRRLEFGLQQGS